LGQAHVELEAAGAEVMSLKTDVTDARQVEEMIGDVVAHYGRLDVVINNAGVIQVGPQDAMGIEDYELAMKSNFWSALYTMLAAIPHFKKQRSGRIVNITSIGGKVAVPHLLPYTASKFALVGLSEGMHAALYKHGIRVTTVVPNLMRTGSSRNAIVKGQHEAEYAWFKLADAAPVLSQNADRAARRIIRAVEYGEPEIMLSPAVSLASFAAGVAPNFIAGVMKLAEALLPANTSATTGSKKGFQSESALSRGPVGALSDKAAVRNNEY
jgi:NAD(P)-dependent dehydrogenase (short-subunit alcohol dehydrogenase family)